MYLFIIWLLIGAYIAQLTTGILKFELPAYLNKIENLNKYWAQMYLKKILQTWFLYIKIRKVFEIKISKKLK